MTRPRPYRVLLVDDDDIFAMLFNESVAEHPELKDLFAVERVADGDQALEYLGRDGHAERLDLILLDQRMPRMDGVAVLEWMRKDARTRRIPVCMLSTSNQARHVEACYALGANFCITKPIDLEELVEKVGQMLYFFAHVIELPERSEPATESA